MKVYGIYVGYDFLSIAVRDADSPIVSPLAIHPLRRTAGRNLEVAAAFKRIASQKVVRAKKNSVAALAFESPENQLWLSDMASDIPDMDEMMSWELFMRTGEPVKDYNVSSFEVSSNKYLAAASKISDIEFFVNQVKRLGLKTVSIEPPIASIANIFEANYDVSGQHLLAFLGCHKITVAYMNNGKMLDLVQNSVHLTELISSEDVMKTRAEICRRNELTKEVPFYLTGDLLADKEYSDFIFADMVNCLYLDPFKMIKCDDANKELMDKYSLAFSVAVSLTQKMV